MMVYIFSDKSANKYGYGTFAPGVGTQYYEYSIVGTFNMDAYAVSNSMRIGTKNDDKDPISNLRKLLIFKGTAIH